MAEIKTSRKDHDVKGVVQAKPFQLCHMRQVESVCVRATNPVHSALAAWVVLLAHAGLRAEDSQRLKAGSCGFTDVAVHGICRNPGVTNMPWAALRCGVLDEDWGKHAWDNLLSICCRLQLDFILPGVAGDFSSLDWSRWATKNEQVACLCFVLTHSQGIAPLSEEQALQFTPHSPRFFYTSVGSTFGFSVSERCVFGNWSEGSTMPKRYDSSFCGEQLTRRGELLGLLQAGWSPPTANAPGLPRAPSGAVGINRVLRQVNQFYLAPVRRTKVPARLFHQMCWNACLLQHLQVCHVFIALTLVIANFMSRNLRTPKSLSAVLCSLFPALSLFLILTG